MSYNTTTIANTFRNLYTTLRRAYEQYAANYGGKQYFLFANVLLKKPDRIPFYFTAEGARIKNNPEGNLDLQISQYYLKERPVYFFDLVNFMDTKIGNKPGYNATNNPPYIILNILVNGTYRDVYINYDSSKMDVTLYSLDAAVFDSGSAKLLALQKALAGYILNLIVAQNQLQLLEKAYAEKRYTNSDFLYNTKYGGRPLIDSAISSLQNDPRFIVKVCKECGGNAALGFVTLPMPNFLTIAGAVSLTWIHNNYTQYDSVLHWLEESTIVVERLIAGIEVQWKKMNGYTLSPEDAKAFSAVKNMANVTVTAKRNGESPASKQAGWAIPAIILLTLSLVGSQK